MQRALNMALRPLRRKIRKMLSRAVIKAVDDSLKAQGLQITLYADEVREDVERFQEYGFTSVPVEGAEAICLSLGGERDHPVVVATEDRRYRPKDLSEGDVAIYELDNGVRVYLERSTGIVHLGGGTSAAELVALGQKTDDRIAAVEDKLDAFISTYNDHIHTTTATIGPSATVGVISSTDASETPLGNGASVQAENVKAT